MKIKEYIRAEKGDIDEYGASLIIVLCSFVVLLAIPLLLLSVLNENTDPDPEITVIEKAQVESPVKEPIVIENSTINIEQVELNVE